MLRDDEFVKVHYIIFLTAIVKLKPKKKSIKMVAR